MKHVIAFATISACLLVLSGGAALANGSGHPNSLSLGTGQPGGSLTPGAAQCGLTAFNPPPGQNQAAAPPGTPPNNHSPFLDGLGSAKVYAGAGANPNSNSINAFSNYDVACSQIRPGQPQVP